MQSTAGATAAHGAASMGTLRGASCLIRYFVRQQLCCRQLHAVAEDQHIKLQQPVLEFQQLTATLQDKQQPKISSAVNSPVDLQQHRSQHNPAKYQDEQQIQQPGQFSAVFEWPGLRTWRSRGIDPRRSWGMKNKPTADIAEPAAAEIEQLPLPNSLVGVALQVLRTANPHHKAALTHRGWQAYCSGSIPLHEPQHTSSSSSSDDSSGNSSSTAGIQQQQQQPPPDRPARPAKPQLVIPKHVPSPKHSPLPLNAHMLHNLSHIELNAIDLAWDTLARFSKLNLPPGFYEDFARVADDESRHFAWCAQRMRELGHEYGDMVAHDLLWEGAQSSAGDLGARLAIVPMSQEARGLDAGQRLAERLVGAGDNRSASIVAAIAEEERAHVAVGVVWFTRLCAALEVDPPTAFRRWLAALGPELLKGPFNHEERQQVGLQREWYDVAAWPEDLQQRLVKPAVAAAAKGKGLPIQQSAVAGVSSGVNNTISEGNAQLAPVTVPADVEQLEQLRQRLWSMVAMEADMCASSSR